MNKIKVLRLVNRFNLGGITYNVSYLSRYLPEEYETLLVGGPEEIGEASSLYIPQSLGLNPVIIPEMRRSLNPFSDYMAYKKILKLIKDFKPDIVHTHASKAGALGRLAAKKAKVPVIVHTFHGHVFHGYFGKIITAFYKNVERFLASRCTAIVAISEIQKKELSIQHRICAESKIKVIPLGFDLDKFSTGQKEKREAFRSRYGIKTDELAIGIIGRLAPVKNHGLFIDAIARCKQNSSRKIKAIIVGDGETREAIKDHIKKAGCSSTNNAGEEADFIFTSWIKEVDVVLAGLDLLCLTSLNEGTPVSLIEAQAASRFVVSTDVGGIRDILHPGCGLLSKAQDKEAFADNLQKAITHFPAYESKAGAASQTIATKFSYRRLCLDMDNLYKQLLAERK